MCVIANILFLLVRCCIVCVCVCTVHSVCRFHEPMLALFWTLVQKDGDRRWLCNRTIPHSHDTFLSRGARCLCLFWRNCLPPVYTLCIVRHVVTLLCILSFCLYALSQGRQFIQFHRSVVMSNIACIQVCLLPSGYYEVWH